MDQIKYEKLHRGIGADPLLYNEDDDIPYTGIAISWYKNGQLKFKGRYKDGVLNGKATWWRRNGEIEHEATYSKGMLKMFCLKSRSGKTE